MKSVLWDKPKVNVYIDLTNADLTTGIHVQIDSFTIAKSVNDYIFNFITDAGVITCCNYDVKYVEGSPAIEINGGDIKYTLTGDLLTGEESGSSGTSNGVERITATWELDDSDSTTYHLTANLNKKAGELYELFKTKMIVLTMPDVPEDILNQLASVGVNPQEFEGMESIDVVTSIVNNHGYLIFILGSGAIETPYEYNQDMVWYDITIHPSDDPL